MVWSLFDKKKIIGLDIGTSTIKIAELDVSRSASLVSFAMAPTPPSAFDTGDIIDTAAIAGVIRELCTKIKTKRNRVAMGLGGSSVIVKQITIPKMDTALISEQIRWEAEQYIPYDINEVNLGFEVIRTQGETMDLLLVAAVQAHVVKYAEVAQITQLSCDVIDVNGFAVANCFRHNYGDMAGQTVALLNVGAAATSLVVLESGKIVFSRDIPVGGMTYTQDLQKGLSISAEEAESIKLSLSGGQAVEEAKNIVEATHASVVEEVKASIDFFYNTSKDAKISRMFISGGGCRTPGLIEGLGTIHATEKLNPFFNITANPKSFSKSYIDQVSDFCVVAVGLGLRKPGDT